MSNSVFNVFEESDINNPQTLLAPSKNQPAFNKSHLTGPLRGKTAGIGGPFASQKRALGDLGNTLANKQPASATKSHLTKFQATSQIGNSCKELGNFNTPQNKPSVSTIQKSASKSQSARLVRNNALFSNVTNTPTPKGSFLHKKISVDMKGLNLATTGTDNSIKPCIDYLDEPEIFPEDSCDTFEDDVTPEHKRPTEQDFDALFDIMNSGFRLTKPTFEPLDIEPMCIEDENLLKILGEDMIISSVHITDFCSAPGIPDVDDMLSEEE